MNKREFATWWEDFEARFPSKASWAAGDGTRATVETWWDILAPCELVDTIEANKRFQLAVEQWPENWEHMPVAIRDVAAKCRARRLTAARQTRDEVENWDGVCGLCHGYGQVIREDEKQCNNAWACPCPAGDKWRRRVRHAKTGKEGPLLATFKINRFSEFDDFNDCDHVF